MTQEEAQRARELADDALIRCDTTADCLTSITAEAVAQEWKFLLDVVMTDARQHRTRHSWSVAYGNTFGLVCQSRMFVMLRVGSFKMAAWLS